MECSGALSPLLGVCEAGGRADGGSDGVRAVVAGTFSESMCAVIAGLFVWFWAEHVSLIGRFGLSEVR